MQRLQSVLVARTSFDKARDYFGRIDRREYTVTESVGGSVCAVFSKGDREYCGAVEDDGHYSSSPSSSPHIAPAIRKEGIDLIDSWSLEGA